MFRSKQTNIRFGTGSIAKWLSAVLLMGMLQSHAVVHAAVQPYEGTVYVSDAAVPADGTSQTSVTLVLKDQAGYDVTIPSERVKFNTTLGQLDGSVISSAYGRYTSALTAPVTAGIGYISAQVDGALVTDIAAVNFKAGAPSPRQTVITASRQTLPADGLSQTVISVILKDPYGNDVSEQAASLQLFTTSGSLGSVTYDTYGKYETSIVSAVYGRLGSWSEKPGGIGPLSAAFEQGAIPAGTPNGSAIPVTLTPIYKSYGTYQAVLTAPMAAGTAKITASLNGMPVTSSVYVAFTQADPANGLTGLAFDQSSYSIAAGQQQLTGLKAFQANGEASNVTPYAAYAITDPAIAAVDSGGLVKGLKSGQTVLSAVYGGFSAETAIFVTAPNTTGDTVTPPSGTQNPPSSQPAPAPAPEPQTGLQVEVISPNGQSGKQTITQEQIKLGEIVLETASADGGQILITAANVKEIAAVNPDAVLVVQTGSSGMTLPISELDPKAYSERYQIPEASIRFELIIRQPDQSAIQAIRQSTGDSQARVLAAPMEFEVRVTGGNDQSVFISTFNRYVSRTLPVNMDSIPETATGVWWVPGSNEFRFVPTTFERRDGQWLAVMKRQGASIYSVIDHPVSFPDVSGHWSSKDVELLASKLIIQGRSKEAFDPDGTITRAEIAALLVRSLGLTEVKGNSPFTDVNGGWYDTAVSTAYQAGLISGYEDGSFRPMQKITREELVAMVIRAMKYTDVKPAGSLLANQPFQDESNISRWALNDVKAAGQLGIIEGDGLFRPASDSTRAEAVAMLKRMLKMIEFI